jgi:hypothetical protein
MSFFIRNNALVNSPISSLRFKSFSGIISVKSLLAKTFMDSTASFSGFDIAFEIITDKILPTINDINPKSKNILI